MPMAGLSSSLLVADLDRDVILQKFGVSYEELLFYMNLNTIGNQFATAAGVLYFYDYITTLDEEITFAWHADFWRSGLKLVYLLNRYLPFAVVGTGFYINWRGSSTPPFVVPPSACQLYPAALILGVANYGTVEIILMLRVWILWERNRWIGIFLSAVFVIGLCLGIGLMHAHIKYSIPLTHFPSTLFPGCGFGTSGEGAYDYFLGASIETISFLLLVSRVWMAKRSSSPIVSALVRHGALYYSVVLTGLILSILANVIEILNFPVLRANLVVIICAVSCNHLMIGLRRVDGSLAQGVTEVEDSMAFAPRHSIDISTAFENADFARTRATDSETAWDVELGLRERGQSTRDTN